MSLANNTYSLIEFSDICIAIKQSEMLTIDQASSVELLPFAEEHIGHFIFDRRRIPTYQLSQHLKPIAVTSDLKHGDYCVGIKTENEENYFSIICNKIEQAEISSATNRIKDVPLFMYGENFVIKSMCQYDERLVLITDANLLHEFISSQQSKEKIHA